MFARPTLRPLVTKGVTFVAVGLATGLATFTALQAEVGSRTFFVLPLAAAAGTCLAALALTRFSSFVLTLLIARASLDLARLGGAGSTAANAEGRLLDPSNLLGALFLVAAALWLAAQHRRGAMGPASAARRALAIFLVAALLSVVGSARPLPSLIEWTRILAAVMMFAVLEQLMFRSREMRRMLVAVFLSAIFPLAYTAFGFVTGNPQSELKGQYIRITGPFGQSNTFGRYLMLLIIFGAAIYPHLPRLHRRLLLVMLLPSGVFLALTYTRSAIVATVIGLVVVGIFQSKRLIGSIVVAGICALLLIPQLGTRFTELTETRDPFERNAGNSLLWRINYWTEVLPLANTNPVTGIGLIQTQFSTDDAKQPHNDFIRAYVEMGLIGFVAYLAAIGAFLQLGRRAIKVTDPATFDRGVAVGFFGCAVAFAAVSLVANVISNVVILWYFLAFAAAASAVVARRTHQQRERLEVASSV